MDTNIDCYFISETFKLARRGEGIVSPNPLVGALVVKDGKIVGKGYHRGKGNPHAESEAIREAGKKAKDATLYVSLEPCCHHGENPPCTDLIISSGIVRVVAPIKDPNPLVNGRGFKKLRDSGIEVNTGTLKEDACQLNAFYLKYIRKKIPYVILKAAMTLDGKIGDPERGIYRITGKESLKEVHRLRNSIDAILLGVGTIISDNPSLTVRLIKATHQPYKIIIDPEMKTPVDAKIFKRGGGVILVTKNKKAQEKYKKATIWLINEKNGVIPIAEILKKAGDFSITSILVEGGSHTFTNFIKANVVDKYYLFYSTSFLGDGISFLCSEVKKDNFKTRIRNFGRDILIEAENVYGNN
jgi:diaminohydroxyphosphoribosylaminopyrimidine deaminase/5-amino-6-(5-phosphoribosylamino)uracil reductase